MLSKTPQQRFKFLARAQHQRSGGGGGGGGARKPSRRRLAALQS
jgi:hypothetical protein